MRDVNIPAARSLRASRHMSPGENKQVYNFRETAYCLCSDEPARKTDRIVKILLKFCRIHEECAGTFYQPMGMKLLRE